MSTQFQRVTFQPATFEEDAENLAEIQRKFEAATVEQLRDLVIGLCETIVNLTSDIPDETTLMVASLHVLDGFLDQPENFSIADSTYH